MLEREVKIRFPDPDLARVALAAIGAVPLRPRRLQDDTLYDTADSALRARRAVVRLRCEPGRAFVTFKGPVEPGPMKLREEQETEVADADVMRRVLHELGLRAWFRYQKFREEFQAPGVILALDETPVGTYLEIEGSEEGILTIADALGRSSADFILDSYRGLFIAFAQSHQLTNRDMLFDAGDPARA
jgi:adenylate cyclase, class 2